MLKLNPGYSYVVELTQGPTHKCLSTERVVGKIHSECQAITLALDQSEVSLEKNYIFITKASDWIR